MPAKVRHNLSDEELVKALVTAARGAHLEQPVHEELAKALHPVKQPRDPYIRELTEAMRREYEQAIKWIAARIERMLQEPEPVKKSLWEKLRTSGEPLRKGYRNDPLSKKEIQQIQQMIRDRFEFIAASMESEQAQIDPQDLKRWKDLGLVDKSVTPKDFVSRNPQGKLIRNAFVYGRFHTAIEAASEEQAAGYTEVVKQALSRPLTRPDKHAVAIAEQQAASYITKFGEEVAGEAAALAREKSRQIVREMVADAHGKKLAITDALGEPSEKMVSTWSELSSELYHRFEDKARDWDRIAFYELNDAKRAGRGLGLLEKYGEGKLVYKTPMPTACAQCKALYLDESGHPRLFRLGEMLAYGSNIGKKPLPVRKGEVAASSRPDGAPAYEPVAGLVHPYCECGGPNVFTGMEWWADKVSRPGQSKKRT